jgi:RNA polymerase sporulation-specific sigma factor
MVDFESNVMLVYAIFNRCFYMHREYEEDLIQEGMIGLLKAVEKFDESRGTKFSIYACIVIRNEMRQYIRRMKRYPEPVSLDEPIYNQEGDNITLLNIVPAEIEEGLTGDQEYTIDLLIEAGRETGNSSIIDMKLKGMTQVDIAKKLGVHPSTVSERMRCCYNLVRQKLGLPEK